MMDTFTKIVIKRGETLIICDEEIIHRIKADVVEVDVPMDYPTCAKTEIVPIQTLAEAWLREVKK